MVSECFDRYDFDYSTLRILVELLTRFDALGNLFSGCATTTVRFAFIHQFIRAMDEARSFLAEVRQCSTH